MTISDLIWRAVIQSRAWADKKKNIKINNSLSKNYIILKWGLGHSSKRGEGGSPTLSPGTDAGRVCTRALHDAKPTKHTQPFTGGKGFGDRDCKLAPYF